MKLRRIAITAAAAAACLTTLAALPQQPVTSSTGRFGDPSGIARKYEGYVYGVVKEKHPNELIVTKTRAGVDQTFKLNKKTKFTMDGKPSSYDNLKVGESIYIDVDTNKKTGELTARKVVSGAEISSIPEPQQP
jgi:hypothetical protein